MSRSKGMALAIIGFLLGAGSFGFIVYDNFLAPAPVEPQPLREVWSDYDGSPRYCLANPASYLNLTMLRISFTLERNATMHFMYTGDAYIDDSSGQSYMYVYWNVGGAILHYAFAMIRGNGSAGFWYFPTCIQLAQQYVPGTYNVTVALQGDSTANCLRESYLVLTAHYD